MVQQQKVSSPTKKKETCPVHLVASPSFAARYGKRWNQWRQQPSRDPVFSLAHDRDRNYADSYSSKLFGSPIPAPRSLYEAGRQSSCRAYEAARRNRPGIQAAAAALVVAVVTVWSTMYWDRRVTTCCDGRALRPPRSYILTILKKMASRGGPSRARTAHMTAAPHDFQCTSGRAGPFWNRGRGASGQGPTIIWSTLDHSCYHYYYYYHFLYLRRFG
jgi:hypothetical protein